jgi:chloride channel 2
MRFLKGSFGLLTIVSIVASLISFSIDMLVSQLYNLRDQFLSLSVAPHYFLWVFYTIVLTLASVFVTRTISAHAAGSGIPQMKAVLRGIALKEYLSLRTLLAKIIGVVFSLGSGLPIGKEGPFVHIASAVAQQIMRRVPMYKDFKENEARRMEILSAACAVGVASSFGAPIGGVLFSIEVSPLGSHFLNHVRRSHRHILQ